MAQDHHVVVIGAGFGGLECVRYLAGSGARVTLIDRRNHHLFQPLLYQVATTILPPSDVAWPIRALLRGRRDVTTLLAEVTGIDGKSVILDDGSRVAFDTLVIATGARHAYFGHDDWEPFAPGLKTIEDATEIRRRILLAFEQAERTDDPALRAALMTFVIIGGGPTGVELAGIIAELAHHTLRRDFRRIDTDTSRVILVEAGDRLLTAFPPDLSAYAARALERHGVTLSFGKAVTGCSAGGVEVGDDTIPCHTIVWAAGVAASPAALWLGVAPDRAGRVMVAPDLTVPGRDDVFVIGDTAAVVWDSGRMVPGIAPAAKQQGAHVAQTIRARLTERPAPGAFRYRHQGNLATIGKSAAVVEMGRLRLTGAIAWWVWGIAHIYFLIGTRSRAAVAWSWLWTYLRGQNSARLIVWPRGRDGLD
jgi:NADH dehydrogenase